MHIHLHILIYNSFISTVVMPSLDCQYTIVVYISIDSKGWASSGSFPAIINIRVFVEATSTFAKKKKHGRKRAKQEKRQQNSRRHFYYFSFFFPLKLLSAPHRPILWRSIFVRFSPIWNSAHVTKL